MEKLRGPKREVAKDKAMLNLVVHRSSMGDLRQQCKTRGIERGKHAHIFCKPNEACRQFPGGGLFQMEDLHKCPSFLDKYPNRLALVSLARGKNFGPLVATKGTNRCKTSAQSLENILGPLRPRNSPMACRRPRRC